MITEGARAQVEAGLAERLRSVLGPGRAPGVVVLVEGAAGVGKSHLPTEQRVALLVREGRTNPEIATALFVSPPTVQTHVSHILAKLGLRSRLEIRMSADVSAVSGS